MTCPNCGAAVADNRRFCGKCGTDLAPSATADPSAAPPPPPSVGATGTPPSSWGAANAPGAMPSPPPNAPVAADAADPFAPPDLRPPPGYTAPGYPQPGYGPPPGYPQPGYGPPPGYPPPPGGYPPPGYPPPGYPQPGYPQPGYGPPPGWQGYAPPTHTNGLAIASFVVSILGSPILGVGSVLAIVFGFVALDQIRKSFGAQRGRGLAIVGIILGFLGAAFWLLGIIGSIVNAGS